MLALSRAIVAVVSALLIFGGFAIAASGELVPAFSTAAIGVIGLAIVGLERMRYRAEADESVAPTSASPGGMPPGEAMEPRFRRTDEVFLDPTTARRMRVYEDPATGERRYRAED